MDLLTQKSSRDFIGKNSRRMANMQTLRNTLMTVLISVLVNIAISVVSLLSVDAAPVRFAVRVTVSLDGVPFTVVH